MQRLGQGLRRRGAARDRLGDLLALLLRAALEDVGVLGHAVVAQQRYEIVAVERAAGAFEGRIFRDLADQHLARNADVQVLGLVVERGLGDEAAEHLVRDAEHLGLVRRDLLADALAHRLQLAAIGTIVIDRGDVRAANPGDGMIADAGEDISDAPYRKAQHEQAE